MEFNGRELAEQLIGTWVTDPASGEGIVSTVTYNPDGTGTEIVSFGEPERPDVTVDIRWSVNDDLLTFKSVASSDPQRVPVNFELHDRILSISEDRFVFAAFKGYGIGDGEQGVKVRRS